MAAPSPPLHLNWEALERGRKVLDKEGEGRVMIMVDVNDLETQETKKEPRLVQVSLKILSKTEKLSDLIKEEGRPMTFLERGLSNKKSNSSDGKAPPPSASPHRVLIDLTSYNAAAVLAALEIMHLRPPPEISGHETRLGIAVLAHKFKLSNLFAPYARFWFQERKDILHDYKEAERCRDHSVRHHVLSTFLVWVLGEDERREALAMMTTLARRTEGPLDRVYYVGGVGDVEVPAEMVATVDAFRTYGIEKLLAVYQRHLSLCLNSSRRTSSDNDHNAGLLGECSSLCDAATVGTVIMAVHDAVNGRHSDRAGGVNADGHQNGPVTMLLHTAPPYAGVSVEGLYRALLQIRFPRCQRRVRRCVPGERFKRELRRVFERMVKRGILKVRRQERGTGNDGGEGRVSELQYGDM